MASKLVKTDSGVLAWLDKALLVGLWVRVCLFLALDPFNSDGPGHLEHIRYVKDHWRLPSAALGHETWQPPLYYFLGALVALVDNTPKSIQLLSLATSIGTLFVARDLLRSATFVRTAAGKTLSFSLVCFLPQFVTYGLQLSNDSLAILLGFAAFHRLDQLMKDASVKQFLGLVSVLCLGLLTKGQFLYLAAFLFPCGCWIYWSRCARPQRQTFWLFAAVLLLAAGCAKYIQNAVEFRDPIISNNDFDPFWLKPHQGTYEGLRSLTDINLFKLASQPTASESTRHSIPLVVHGTFWYDYLRDSNLQRSAFPYQKYLGGYLQLLGAVPDLLFALGCIVAFTRIPRYLKSRPLRPETLVRFCSAAGFLAGIGMMLWLLFKYDAWILLLGRHLFPTLIGAFVLGDLAIEWLQTRFPIGSILTAWRHAFLVGAAAYFGSGIALQFQ